MKRAIITPTFSGHFKYIEKYLKSCDVYMEDKNFPIYFIINSSENEEFRKVIRPYEKKLNINICFLEDILKNFSINETPEELLKKYGRLSFQTIKKLYGALYIGADQFLLLDSESMLIKPTKINNIFDEYFKNKKIFISRIKNRRKEYFDDFTYEFIRNIVSLMNKEPEFYTTETYEWFYELRILKDLIKKLGEPIDIIRNYKMPNKFHNLEGILEALLYYQYLIYNNTYNYKIYIVDDELKKYLGDCYLNFKKDFDTSPFWACGVLECLYFFINKKNYKSISRFLNDFNITVMRIENPSKFKNVIYQNFIIKHSNISITASSQNNIFGINKKIKTLLINNKFYSKLINNKFIKLLRILLIPFSYVFSVFSAIYIFIRLIFSLLNMWAKTR